jgi:hypothetical protein
MEINKQGVPRTGRAPVKLKEKNVFFVEVCPVLFVLAHIFKEPLFKPEMNYPVDLSSLCDVPFLKGDSDNDQ